MTRIYPNKSKCNEKKKTGGNLRHLTSYTEKDVEIQYVHAKTHKPTHTHKQSQLCQLSSRTHLDVSPGHREQVVGLRHGAELC